MKNKKRDSQEQFIPIYLDKSGYEELLSSIEELKNRIKENNRGRREAFNSETNDGCLSSEFLEIERIDFMLSTELERKIEMLSRVVIVETPENSEQVNIGDVVILCISHDGINSDERLFKIVGGMPVFDPDAEIQEISINSPIGKAIFQKTIGEVCNYTVNNNKFSVLIKEKVDLSKKKDIKKKKLTK